MHDVAGLLRRVREGDRRSLSKAITLLESSREGDRRSAAELVAQLAGSERSFRVGVTGVPGAGKSTLIDALGMRAVEAGRRVAVLAVDPSSRQSGGSVLGDKTRMTRLASHPHAFVRPSPTRGVLGGIAGRTRECIALCETAGFDLVLVETVGVGQSEEQVASMVDCVLLVLLVGAGDELSSMKRGLLEVADLIAFNKADRERAAVADNEAVALSASLGLSRAKRLPRVLAVSALEGAGIDRLWSALGAFETSAQSDGSMALRRADQLRAWFEAALDDAFRTYLAEHRDLSSLRAAALQAVLSGTIGPNAAAQRLVGQLLGASMPES